MTPREVLLKLKEAGLDSMPGGGAEIFSDRVRHIICDHKIDGDEWLEMARTAHELGLKSNATMLYGHIENDEDRVDHLLKLRALQDDTHGFQTFIPLAFHPDNTPLQHLPKTTGMLDLKQIAVARLVLDNFPHIKSYWQMVTPKMAQITLRFGADDIDGTVVEEKIYHDAGATTPQGLRRQDLIRLITEAGRVPVRARHAVPAGDAHGNHGDRGGVGPTSSAPAPGVLPPGIGGQPSDFPWNSATAFSYRLPFSSCTANRRGCPGRAAPQRHTRICAVVAQDVDSSCRRTAASPCCR